MGDTKVIKGIREDRGVIRVMVDNIIREVTEVVDMGVEDTEVEVITTNTVLN
jgi:Flp pilus assembly CpaE family ATPase